MWFIFQNFISDVEYLLHSIKPTILSIPALSKLSAKFDNNSPRIIPLLPKIPFDL